ncbi:hypothetical protein CRV24_007934 [Beauveria bassiana]|nr:hypothetical protein CRV24_007934 [Beauveria bassiana]
MEERYEEQHGNLDGNSFWVLVHVRLAQRMPADRLFQFDSRGVYHPALHYVFVRDIPQELRYIADTPQ